MPGIINHPQCTSDFIFCDGKNANKAYSSSGATRCRSVNNGPKLVLTIVGIRWANGKLIPWWLTITYTHLVSGTRYFIAEQTSVINLKSSCARQQKAKKPPEYSFKFIGKAEKARNVRPRLIKPVRHTGY